MSGALSAPGVLGQYRILGRIADGANARVKLGEHTLTGARVALKFISRTLINDMNIGPQVSREIQYLRLLRHPHIIKLYEVIITTTDIVLVMEYAHDELFNIIERRGRMSEAQARPWFQQLMYALAYSHSLQVVHRDLKPENILLAEDAEQRNGMKVKIADFGLSNEWSDGDWLKTGCGTPHYAAPEIIQGHLYGVEVDVWSCGAILYVMVCGCLPYDHDNMAVLFNRIAHADYQIPEGIHLSPQLMSLIEGMMTVDPTKRLTVSEVLAHEWTRPETPRYLRQIYRRHMPARPAPILSSLSSLVNAKEDGVCGEDDEDEDGACDGSDARWDESIVHELSALINVDVAAVMDALLVSEDNAVKVAYALCADQRAGYDLRPVGEQEVVAQLSAPGSAPPSRHLPTTEDVLGYSEDDDEEDFDATSRQLEWRLPSTFAVLSIISSSPPATNETSAERADRRRQRRHQTNRLAKPKAPLWHFGIRSVSPPMEVMAELYKSLQSLGIEWREKRGPWMANAECCATDDGYIPSEDDSAIRGASKDDLDIFTIELRWRKRNIVALMKLRLYQTDPEAYMVDFVWVGHYKASSNPHVPRFSREDSLSKPPSDANIRVPRRRSSSHLSVTQSTLPADIKPPKSRTQSLMNPILFFECTCELIAELTGVGAEVPPT